MLKKGISLLRVWISNESSPSEITLDGIPDRLGSIHRRIVDKMLADKFPEFLSKPDLFLCNGAFTHPLLPISRFEILRTFSDVAIPNVDINVQDVAQNQQLIQFFRVSVATHDYLATEYRALPAQVTGILTAVPISWDQLDKPSKKVDAQWILLKNWDRLIDQCPGPIIEGNYKFTLDSLRAHVFLEKTSAILGLEDLISRVLSTESEFAPLSNHLLSCVQDSTIRAVTQQHFWKSFFFDGSFGTGSSFLEWDAAHKSGATILTVLGIPVLNGDFLEADVDAVNEAICINIERFVSESASGQLTAHHTMTSLLAMLKAASSQSSDLAETIRSVVAHSELGVFTDRADKRFNDAFSQRIFKEFHEFLRANTRFDSADQSGSGSVSVHGNSPELVRLTVFADSLFNDIDGPLENEGVISSPRSSRASSLDGSNFEELAQELNMVSSASSGSLNSSSISTDKKDANLTSAPGSSDWWRNLNERIQRLCEKLKEIDSRTHFLAPLLKHESSAVPPKPVSAEVPLRKIRTGVPLKNNVENSGNKKVQSFNNRRRFSTGFFSRLFPRIRG